MHIPPWLWFRSGSRRSPASRGWDIGGIGRDHDDADVLRVLGADRYQKMAGIPLVEHVGPGAVEAHAVAVDSSGEADVALIPGVVALRDGEDQARLASSDSGAASRILLIGKARQHGQGGKDGVGQVRVGD